MGGSVSAAFGSNYARRRLQATGPYEITAGSFLAGGLLTLPLILVVPGPTVPALADYGYLLLLGGVMSALAYTLYFRLVADLGATRAISVEFFVTAIAVIIGAVALHERLSATQLAGGGAVIAACCLVLGLIPRRAAALT
ncbi:MAG TPA: DMT family transporter [Streptosporangiaceae bacterium]|jgi:drug/metabolite transporter (DMT)-like permease